MSRPTVLITNGELLRILAGSAMVCGAMDGGEIEVRLPTPAEFLAKHREARARIAEQIGKPLDWPEATPAEVEQLCEPIDVARLIGGAL